MLQPLDLPHLVLGVGHLGYYSSIEPHQVSVSVFGDYTSTDVQDLQGWVVVKGHMVSRQQTLSFVFKLHLVLEDIVSWTRQRSNRCIKYADIHIEGKLFHTEGLR